MERSHKEPAIPFTPVHVSSRHDGWTAERQIAFIEALAETACVEQACRAVGMSDSAAYKLRQSARGEMFRHAWDAALDYAFHRLEQAALSRALHGVPRPIFHKGEQVGEWRDYDERLTMFLLRSRRAARYGKWLEKFYPKALPTQDETDEAVADNLVVIEENAADLDAATSRARVEERTSRTSAKRSAAKR